MAEEIATTKVEETRVIQPVCQNETVSSETLQLKALTELQIYARGIARKEFIYNLTSPQIGEITKSLVRFKKNMPDLRTDKTAGGRYSYQSLPGLINAITEELAECDCIFMQPIHTIEDKTYVITMIIHASGQYIRSLTIVPDKYTMAGKVINTNENLQAMGGALTYTKRHALKSLLGIDADDDNDGNQASNVR